MPGVPNISLDNTELGNIFTDVEIDTLFTTSEEATDVANTICPPLDRSISNELPLSFKVILNGISVFMLKY
jgi:hypothetical protein